jgi:hypothetical protein
VSATTDWQLVTADHVATADGHTVEVFAYMPWAAASAVGDAFDVDAVVLTRSWRA